MPRTLAPFALTVALVVGAAGCGSDDPAGSGTPPPATATETTRARSGAPTALRLVLWPKGPAAAGAAAARRVSTVTCPADPSSGPCRRLLDLPPEVLSPDTAGRVCTQVFDGPEVLEVAGTVAGRTVETRLQRNNGCEIERWNAAAALLLSLARP